MSTMTAVRTEFAEEIVEGYLARMAAPAPDEAFLDRPYWWRKGAGPGLVVGLLVLLVGTVAYLLIGIGRPAEAGARPSPSSTAPPPQQQALAPTPDEVAAPHKDESALVEPVVPRPKKRGSELKAAPKQSRWNREFRRLLRRGWRLYRQGDLKSASIAFGRAVRAGPGHTGGYYGLALCLFEQGEEDAALQVLEWGDEKLGPRADLWVLAGSIYQWMGKEQMARAAYRRYLEKSPHGALARDIRAILAREELPRLIPADDRERGEHGTRNAHRLSVHHDIALDPGLD